MILLFVLLSRLIFCNEGSGIRIYPAEKSLHLGAKEINVGVRTTTDNFQA